MVNQNIDKPFRPKLSLVARVLVGQPSQPSQMGSSNTTVAKMPQKVVKLKTDGQKSMDKELGLTRNLKSIQPQQ